jgi:two-component system chemotaxis sensor kinase CheA
MDMLEQDEEVIREFLVESHENLSRLDQEIVELEKHPKHAALLASIFRTIHTIKGSCGFLSFSILEKITHQAESILSQLRDGKRDLNPQVVSLILETVDATRRMLASIEATGREGPDSFDDLTERLREEAQSATIVGSQPGVSPPPPPSASEPPAKPLGVLERGPVILAAEAPEESAPTAHPESSAVADANIRVGVELLDKLMDLVGELVLTRNQILQFNAEREDASLNATSQRLNLITTELQEGVMKTRMQPIGVVWNKLPRVVRDMAVALGKQIRLELDGTGTELDRTIIEAISDPLVHLVRNSCGHGIERPDLRIRAGKPPQGTLTLRAYHEGGQVNIEIADDGAGIDVQRVKRKAIEKGLIRSDYAEKMSDREALGLVFLAGFSTSEIITNVSGRGVGMDVVKSHIEKIGGVVDMFSRPGEGTTVKLKIPLTLAIIPGLVISSGGELFVIPQVSLIELIRVEKGSLDKFIEHVHQTPVYRRRGSLLPIAYLNEVLGLATDEDAEAVNIVVLQAEDRQFGLVVDGIYDTQEIVVKPLAKQLKGIPVYAGATIMGDGRVALILDVLGVGQSSGVLTDSREQGRGVAEKKAQSEVERQRLLLFRAGSFERLAVPLTLVARLEEFPRASIERAGGREVVQYRDRILPLVNLQTVLESSSPERSASDDPVQVIVFHDLDRSVGLVVEQILDIVEEAVTVRQKTSRDGLLGSAVVGTQVADFLDLNYVIRGDWFAGNAGPAGAGRILVAEASRFSRGLIRSGLEMAGYHVSEAADMAEAIQGLERQPVDMVVAALGLPPSGCSGLHEAMRRRPEWESIPVLALADSADQIQPLPGTAAFEDCQPKFDREAMLESLLRLASATAKRPVCVLEGQ